MQVVQGEDNEIIVQKLLNGVSTGISVFRSMLSNGNDQYYTNILTGMNVGISLLGYKLCHNDIPRSDMLTIVHYAKINSHGQLFRSQYHPIRLREFMKQDEIPEAFNLLFYDIDYLPNIMTIWDRGQSDTITLISFQKINIHYNN
jgi:hypothetical protein